MKFIIAFAFLIAGISAIPQPEQEEVATNERRPVDGVYAAVEKWRQTITDAGLDPVHIEREGSSFALPVPELFNYEVFVEDVMSKGLSDIHIYYVDYSWLTDLLKFVVEIPYVNLSVGAASAEGTILGAKGDIKASGQVQVFAIMLDGAIYINYGIISSPSLRKVELTFTVGRIESDVKLEIQGQDYSAEVNNFISSTVHDRIGAYHHEINHLLEGYLWDAIIARL